MKTIIYENYSAFLRRENKDKNGVSPGFAELNPDYQEKNESNKACWNCSDCSDCSGCSDCSDCSRCSRCSGCSDCSDCSRCSGCSDCSRCSDCSDCSGYSAAPNPLTIPKVERIHSRVLAAVSQPNALDMSTWHTCETTHCRAGWVVTLAGEPGKALEERTSTEFAAMMIYKESSEIRVPPTRFYDPTNAALDDIKRCAELEAAL